MEARRQDAVHAFVFALLWAAFVAVSWAKWPLVTADSARELYVPFQIRHGALIYHDFAYLYGPVAPYLQAGLLGLCGERLAVLYTASVLGLALTMGLLYALARQLLPPLAAAAVLWVFFTHFALGRDIAGYCWPYAFAATDAVAFGLAMLLALVLHARRPRRGLLVLAGVMLGVSLVTKLEYGFAAAGLAVVYGGLRGLMPTRPGWRTWAADALALALPALAVAGAIAGAVLAAVPWPEVQASVWPTALMRLWHSQGTWHGTPADWLWNARWLALAASALGLVWGAPRLAAGLRRREPLAWLAVVALAALLVALATVGRFWPAHAPVYWMGPGFVLLLGTLGWGGLQLARAYRAGEAPPAEVVGWVLVATYGCLVAVRTFAHGYNEYTRYQAPVALIVWVGLAWQALPAWLARRGWPLNPRGAALALGLLLGVLGGANLQRELAGYTAAHVAVTGGVGTVLADTEHGGPFAAALAYVRQHLQPGEAIVAAPMEASFYLFAGRENVLHEDQLYFGYLTTPAEQRAAIARMQARHVRYVLVSTYGREHGAFGVGYMQDLGAWLHGSCRRVATYGDAARYAIDLYETPNPRSHADFRAATGKLEAMPTPRVDAP